MAKSLMKIGRPSVQLTEMEQNNKIPSPRNHLTVNSITVCFFKSLLLSQVQPKRRFRTALRVQGPSKMSGPTGKTMGKRGTGEQQQKIVDEYQR